MHSQHSGCSHLTDIFGEMQLGKLTITFAAPSNSIKRQPFLHSACALRARFLHFGRAISKRNLPRGNQERFITLGISTEEDRSMKRLFTGSCLAALCAVTLSAQTPSQPPASPAGQDTMKTVTATGCLRAGDQPDSFVLSNVKWSDKAAGATGTSGTPATPAPSATSIKLIGAPAGEKLTEHIGHTVEVTGSIAPKSPSAAPPAGEATGGKAKDEPSLNVRTVKMVSSSCDAK
jgi:hypothetical protein